MARGIRALIKGQKLRAIKSGNIRPIAGKCPDCGVPAKEFCRNWCCMIDPLDPNRR